MPVNTLDSVDRDQYEGELGSFAADAFWGEDAEAVHRAVPTQPPLTAQASVGPDLARSHLRLLMLPLTGVVMAVMAVVVLSLGGGPGSPRTRRSGPGITPLFWRTDLRARRISRLRPASRALQPPSAPRGSSTTTPPPAIAGQAGQARQAGQAGTWQPVPGPRPRSSSRNQPRPSATSPHQPALSHRHQAHRSSTREATNPQFTVNPGYGSLK